jgi:hypothetical protein
MMNEGGSSPQSSSNSKTNN